MNDQKIAALDIARALLPHLPGWTLGEDSQRHIRENDSATSWHADLTNPEIPGSDLNINTTREQGRLSISANYPRDWYPWIEGTPGQLGHRRYSESITVSATKTPAQIARDIQRRLFDATGYFARLAECLERKAASERAQESAETVAAGLAAVVGTVTKRQRYKGQRGCSHLDTDENARAFDYWPHSGTSSARLECTVDYNGKSADLKIHSIDPKLAREILAAFKRHADHTKPAEPVDE